MISLTTIFESGIVENKLTLFSEKFWEVAEFNRLGISAMLLLFTVCLGAIAAGFGMDGSVAQLGMVVFPTAFGLTMVLGEAPMKIVLGVCSLDIFIDLMVLIF